LLQLHLVIIITKEIYCITSVNNVAGLTEHPVTTGGKQMLWPVLIYWSSKLLAQAFCVSVTAFGAAHVDGCPKLCILSSLTAP
jgi:hypothetical protein